MGKILYNDLEQSELLTVKLSTTLETASMIILNTIIAIAINGD